MNLPTQPSLHLIVIGSALVILGLRPAAHPVVRPTAAATPHDRVVASSVMMHRRVLNSARDQGALLVHKGRRHVPSRSTHTSNTVSRATSRTGPSFWAALHSAITRIPTYRPGIVRWVVSDQYGQWGTADWYHATLYISPKVPDSYLYDVAVHEWSHELSVLDYRGDVQAATAAMNRAFGGSGLTGAERAADCMARLQGATWTHYTSCVNPQWKAKAARLVRGGQL